MNKSKVIISLVSFILIIAAIFYIYSSSEKQRIVKENEIKETKDREIIDSKVEKLSLALKGYQRLVQFY